MHNESAGKSLGGCPSITDELITKVIYIVFDFRKTIPTTIAQNSLFSNGYIAYSWTMLLERYIQLD